MLDNEPLISVIMSNYNTPETYLRQAIESILGQTYKKIEFIIVDDCSSNNSLKIICDYCDDRIHLIKNENNIGITRSLNKALQASKGDFIARMDSDDISLPERFEKQVTFLQNHQDVIVCGTWAEIFGDGYNDNKKKMLCNVIPPKDEYSVILLFGNGYNIIHPTAMFRHDYMIKNKICYDERYRYAQDYKMWITCNHFGECAIVPEVLFKYRIHDKAISSNKVQEQRDCVYSIIEEQLKILDIKLDKNNFIKHQGLIFSKKSYDEFYYKWLEKIINKNSKKHIYNQNVLEKLLYKKMAENAYNGIADTNCRFFDKFIRLIKIPSHAWWPFIKIFIKKFHNLVYYQ